MTNDALTELNRISEPPASDEAFAKWLEMGDAIAFLRRNCSENELVVYASNRTSFIHTVLVPSSLVSPPDYDDLSNWSCDPTSSWSIDIRYSEPRHVWISPPLGHTGSRTLDAGEQMVFHRRFEGRRGKKGYFEILQKFIHVFELHLVEERASYCRLDRLGDLEDMIRVVEMPRKGDELGTNAVVINRSILDEYMVLTKSAIVRMFDFTRFQNGMFSGWRDRAFSENEIRRDLSYRVHIEPGYASFMRGFQLLHPAVTEADVFKAHDYMQRDAGREYVSYVAHDWKNKLVREVSTAPGATSNYFTASDLPFETTPAFFRPEVLLKYKSDSEKYSLESRSISCRGGWSLRTFDINDAGQVHSYIVYLRDLPYEEQLHWKAHNEEPKAPISRRAVTTDFEGTCHLDYDPLTSLQDILHQWYTTQVPWWTLRAERLINVVHYPVTASQDEWSGELLRLDQLVVEGFETKWLRANAQANGRQPDLKVASLKLIEECLLGLGFEQVEAINIAAPLRELRDLRTKMKGHALGSEGTAIQKAILKEHKTFKAHFQELCRRCDESLRTIESAFSS